MRGWIFDRGNPDATNKSHLTVGSEYAFGGIERGHFRQDSGDQILHGIAVLWMKAIQVFLDGRSLAGRIESVDSK